MIELHRIDDTQNMRRFYRLDMQPDLFGGVFLIKQWGRIGTPGRTLAERFDEETQAYKWNPCHVLAKIAMSSIFDRRLRPRQGEKSRRASAARMLRMLM